MKKRMQLLKDYASTTNKTWLFNQLELLESDIELYMLEVELETIEESISIVKGNQLLSNIKNKINEN